MLFRSYIKLVNSGIMTPNEAREQLGLNGRYDEGNSFYMPSTLVEIGEAPIEKRDTGEIDSIIELEEVKQRIKKIESEGSCNCGD